MKLGVDPEIFELFPGLRIVVVFGFGLDNERKPSALDEGWRQAWASATEALAYGNAQSHPRVRPWREAWRRIGISGRKFPSSVEALLRRAMKGGEPFSINPLVDFYNSVSLRHRVPAGGFDLRGVDGPIELRLSRAGDTFQALDEDVARAIPAGEVAYAAGSTVLTRHLVWKQSRVGLIGPQTTDALLVSEILGELPDEALDDVRRDLENGLRSLFKAEAWSAVADERAPVIEREGVA